MDASAVDRKKEHTTRHVLVIDLGGTGIKAAVVADSGQVIAESSEPIETVLLTSGGAEQDAVQWWDCAVKVSRKVVRQAGVSPESIVSVCCDSQFSVIVPVDRDANPLSSAIHWFDSRGAPYTKTLMAGFPTIQGLSLFKALKWIRITGLAPTRTGVDSLAHMLFIRHELPDIYDKTYKFLEPMDYITSRLTGRISATQHTVPLMMLTSNRVWGERAYSDSLLKLTYCKVGMNKVSEPEYFSVAGWIQCTPDLLNNFIHFLS